MFVNFTEVLDLYYYYHMHQKSGLFLLSFTIIVSLMAGTYILMKDWNFTGRWGYAVSLGLALGAMLYAGQPRRSWAALASMLAGAMYIYLRASGRISFSLLRYSLGFGMLGYGLFGLFTLFRILKQQEARKQNQNT
jgi:hypothetical protein